MSKEFLEDLKSGDIVVRELTGGGFKTKSLITIEKVVDDGIFIEGADGYYSLDSTCLFSKTTGKSKNNYVVGFYSTLLRIANDEDITDLDDEMED